MAANGSYLTSLESGYWATARRARIACVIIAQAEVPDRRQPLAATMLLWVAINDAHSATPSCARVERWYPLLGNVTRRRIRRRERVSPDRHPRRGRATLKRWTLMASRSLGTRVLWSGLQCDHDLVGDSSPHGQSSSVAVCGRNFLCLLLGLSPPSQLTQITSRLSSTSLRRSESPRA